MRKPKPVVTLPRFASATCIFFEFWLVHCIGFVTGPSADYELKLFERLARFQDCIYFGCVAFTDELRVKLELVQKTSNVL